MIALTTPSQRVAALACGTLLSLCACGSAPETSPPSAKQVRPAPAAAAAELRTNMIAAHRSAFGSEANLRDPFFPKSRKSDLREGGRANDGEPQANYASLLQAGFQGVIGTDVERLAMVYNVILEPKKKATIIVRNGAKEVKIPVRCREISKDGVVLEVPGQALVRLTQSATQTQPL